MTTPVLAHARVDFPQESLHDRAHVRIFEQGEQR